MSIVFKCGLADYQVRRWDAWHHHMALVMLGTLFLIKQKSVGRQQWPMLSLNDLVIALAGSPYKTMQVVIFRDF